MLITDSNNYTAPREAPTMTKRITRSLAIIATVLVMALALTGCNTETVSHRNVTATFTRSCPTGIVIDVHNDALLPIKFRTYQTPLTYHTVNSGATVTVRYPASTKAQPWVTVIDDGPEYSLVAWHLDGC